MEVRYLALFLLFSEVKDGKSSQEYSVNVGVPQGSILGSTFSLLYIMTFLTMLSVILLSMLIILLSKCDQASDLWQELKLASELESDLQDTVDWDKLISMLEKLWFCLTNLIMDLLM